MVRMPRKIIAAKPARAGVWAVAAAFFAAAAGAFGQSPPVHFWQPSPTTPGAVGAVKLLRGGPVAGYPQTVEIRGPEGTLAGLPQDGRFEEPQTLPRKVGLQIGPVYRLKVTNLPFAPGVEVFPTIEMIDRLYTPTGQQRRFAVPIEFTREDLEMAAAGKFITRVFYIEDPQDATPASQIANAPSWFDLKPGQDPLAVADGLGRPIAIVRLGGRVPDQAELTSPSFLYGCPPWTLYEAGAAPAPPVAAASGVEGPPLPFQPTGPWSPAGIQRPWPADEYLRDGGDKQTRVEVDRNFQVRGLEAEDTVAHFDTLDGRTLVQPSNEVFIYSPRFASVRLVVSLVQNEQNNRLADVHGPTKLTLQEDVRGAKQSKQQWSAERQLGLKHATAMRMKQTDGAVSSGVKALGFQNAYKPYEDLAVIRYGQMLEAEAPLLAKSAQAATIWTNKQSVQIILERQVAQEVVRNQRAEVTYTVDKPPSHPKLRVVKVASTQFANPGETISFTLRFDNVGNETIGNVTILDNLTSRLEYVPKSAQCSIAAQFITERNEAGSDVLRWEIRDPLPVGKGGVVRFDCRVR